MDIKALMQKYGVTVGVAGGCLVIGSQYGSCTVAPQPVAVEVEEEAVKEEPVAEEKAEEAKEEEPKDGAE